MDRDSRFDGLDRNRRETAVSRRSLLRGGAAGLAATVGLAGLSTPVAAEEGAIWDLRNDDGDRGSLGRRFEQARSSLSGAWERMTADADKRTAPESAQATTQVFNDNSTVLVEYANDQLSTSREKTDFDVIRVVFKKEKTARRWIVADVDDSNTYTAARMVDSEPSRKIDHWVKLERLAATEAPDELERFVDEYASENRSIDPALEGRFAGKYGRDVSSSLL